MLLSHYIALPLGLGVRASSATVPTTTPLAVHNITRFADIKFENLAIRQNGQILTTISSPNAMIYQVDPLGILPPALIYDMPSVGHAAGIVEGSRPDVFYVAFGTLNITEPTITYPDSYSIMEIDVRDTSVLPDGNLTKPATVRKVASLPEAALPNGIDFARPDSDNLLVADSFRGLIWNVNICDGTVGVALNDSTTKGATDTGPTFTGANGLKVWDDELYWTSTGANSLYKIRIDRHGMVQAGQEPVLVASNLTCDDFVLSREGNAYVAGPLNVLTKVSPDGQQEIIAGTFNSTTSPLVGPTAARFGRLASDRWSLYVTTNGGVTSLIPGTAGVSRVDLGQR